jgi:DNA-binding response OmpR family regulator
MRVLLVDDEEELISALAERLILRGIEAEWFTCGQSALERVSSGCFDLAVLDVKMPRIGGLELREKMRTVCPDMKFIFLTGYGSERDFLLATARETHVRYLVKPVEIGVLLAEMKSLVESNGAET